MDLKEKIENETFLKFLILQKFSYYIKVFILHKSFLVKKNRKKRLLFIIFLSILIDM